MISVHILLVSTFLLALSTGTCFRSPSQPIRTRAKVVAVKSAKSEILSLFGDQEGNDNLYVDPQTLSPLKKVRRVWGVSAEYYFQSVDWEENRYPITSNWIDLTIPAEQNKPIFQASKSELLGQSFFQNPFVSGIYERGYRQNFENIGFPGIDKEFEEALTFFKQYCNASTSIVLDLSCGSGFMSRKFMKSKEFGRVIAADLSPTMLLETKRRCVDEGISSPELVRLDSARLPFATGSIDCIHSGAALHCWPRLADSLSEIYRVLKPGGVFFATTFFTQARALNRRNRGFYFFEDEQELEKKWLGGAGFEGQSGAAYVRREGKACAVCKAIKFSKDEGEESKSVLRDLLRAN